MAAPQRRSGILCHPACLPGPDGIGDLGEGAWRFLEFLHDAGQRLWQVLPLGPTGYGDSPYQPFSAFAGNPLLISLETLRDEGLLEAADLAERPPFSPDRVDYGAVIEHKERLLRRAYARLRDAGPGHLRAAWEAYTRDNAHWLDDFALFMALKREFGWAPWVAWPGEIAMRREGAVADWGERLADEVAYRRFLQFVFDRQWGRLRARAAELGIAILGDMPIFVGHDSADVWAHRDLYYLDERGMPTVVAGVPPDYFSATGQRWGNPLYRWDRMRERGYDWWLARLAHALTQVDLVRIDHFRGLAGYWEVPAEEETAIHGHWVAGPGRAFLQAVRERLGAVPIVAEDLGLISADVTALREEFGLPGMRVLQFGLLGDAANPHLPHNYAPNTVAYTGTHDNDTAQGWFREQEPAVQHRARVYTGSDDAGIHWALVRAVCNSVADTAIYPLQDVLGLGGEARLNLPGRPHGNWAWRVRPEALSPDLARALCEMAEFAGRWAPPGAELTGATAPTIHYDPPGSPVRREGGISP